MYIQNLIFLRKGNKTCSIAAGKRVVIASRQDLVGNENWWGIEKDSSDRKTGGEQNTTAQT
jgi:hypothetical protein